MLLILNYISSISLTLISPKKNVLFIYKLILTRYSVVVSIYIENL